MSLEGGAARFATLVEMCRSFAVVQGAIARLDAETKTDVDVLVTSLLQDDLDRHERESIYGTLAMTCFPETCRAISDRTGDARP